MAAKCVILFSRKENKSLSFFVSMQLSIPVGETAVKKDLNSLVLWRVILFITEGTEPDVEIVYSTQS